MILLTILWGYAAKIGGRARKENAIVILPAIVWYWTAMLQLPVVSVKELGYHAGLLTLGSRLSKGMQPNFTGTTSRPTWWTSFECNMCTAGLAGLQRPCISDILHVPSRVFGFLSSVHSFTKHR